MGGRPRLPTELKKLAGTLQPCRTNPDEPQPPATKPLAPANLTAVEAREYDRHWQLLDGMGVGTVADVFVLERLAKLKVQLDWAEAHMAQHGMILEVTDRHGTTSLKTNPSVNVASDADRRYTSLLIQVGLTPAARSRVSAVRPLANEPAPSDEFAIFGS